MTDSIKTLYTPCIIDSSGYCLKRVGPDTTRQAAENILKRNHLQKWRMCEAMPIFSNNPKIHD